MKKILSILIISFLMLTHVGVLQADTAVFELEPKDKEITLILDKAEVYPNPAENYIYIKINEKGLSSDVKIEVMSIIGNKMMVNYDKIDSGLYKIDLSNIPVGHYYVMLAIDTQKSLKKFIKQ